MHNVGRRTQLSDVVSEHPLSQKKEPKHFDTPYRLVESGHGIRGKKG